MCVCLCVFAVVPADCREILLPLMTEQLKFHLENCEELKACCQLLSDILEVLYRKDVVRNEALCRHLLSAGTYSRIARGSRRDSTKKGRFVSPASCSGCVLLPKVAWKDHILSSLFIY